MRIKVNLFRVKLKKHSCIILFFIIPLCFFNIIPLNLEDNVRLDLENSSEPLLVSLGDCCQAAWLIKYHGWRVKSFPFDWNVFNVKDIGKILETNFEFFLTPNYLKQVEEIGNLPPNISGFKNHIYNTHYNLLFVHCDPFALEWQKTFLKRIERFRQLGNYPGKVFFIYTTFNSRDSLEINDIRKLYTSLHTYFPLLDFEIIIFQEKMIYKEDIKNIKTTIFPLLEDCPAHNNQIALSFSKTMKTLGLPKKELPNLTHDGVFHN